MIRALQTKKDWTATGRGKFDFMFIIQNNYEGIQGGRTRTFWWDSHWLMDTHEQYVVGVFK